MRKRLIAAVASLCTASTLLCAQGVQIQTLPKQGAIAGEPFVLALSAMGGVPAYTWMRMAASTSSR